MSPTYVLPEGVGRACPYCRFPLKGQDLAERFPSCSAQHHADRWNDNGGCAIHGCSHAVAAPAAAGAKTPPPAPPAFVPAPSPAPAPAPGGSSGDRRGALLGMLLMAAIVLTGLVAYLRSSRTTDESDRAAVPIVPTTVTVAATPTGVPASSPPEPTATPTPTSSKREGRVARQLLSAVDLSIAGRSAVRAGGYGDAIDNRRDVLSRIDAISGATGRAAQAKSTLRKAMQASLSADEAYASGGDATSYDAEATRLKRSFVGQYEPLADARGLPAYADGDF